MQTKRCAICETEFQLRANNAWEQKFCSKKCRRKAEAYRQREQRAEQRKNKKPVIKICPICGTEFERSRNVLQVYCSTYCYRRSDKYKKHRNEYKRIHPWKKKRICDANYKDKIRFKGNREKALERDMYRCTTCGECKKSLVVHHMGKKENGEYPDALHELKWLTTLCRSCHAKIHMPSILEGQRKKS